MRMCEHRFKSLKIERDGKRVQACQECGALKIGEDTIVVDEDYIELSPLTADPALAEGRVWFRSDEDEQRWSPDGTKVEVFGTTYLGGPDLTSIVGFTYFAEGVATDSWYFTSDPNKDVWIRQYSTNACFQPKYNFYGTYAHWTADNTFVDVPNKAENVYGAGEVLSVSLPPDGTEFTRWDAYYKIEDGTWDGKYLAFAGAKAVPPEIHAIYRYKRDGTFHDSIPTPSGNPSGLTWDGNYYWYSDATCVVAYQINEAGSTITKWPIGETGGPEGVTWDGKYLWFGSRGTGTSGWLYKYLPDGTWKDTMSLNYNLNEGLGWDGTYMWGVSRPSGTDGPQLVYRLKKDGSYVDHWSQPGPVAESCCWDGKYIWCDDESSATVYGFRNGSFDLNYEVTPA